MDLYERQQFDFLLNAAVERFVERIEQRNQGPELALQRLRSEPEGDGIWLSEFVKTFFSDFLLDNPDGACFILRALASRPTAPVEGKNIGEAVGFMARSVFSALLRQKTEEMLEQRVGYQPIRTGA